MQSHDTDTDGQTMNKQTQRQLMWTYKSLFILQLVTGVVIIASSSCAFMFDQGTGGVPYYPGGYLIGVLMLTSSVLAFRVWYRVPHINTNIQARKDVLRAINFHHHLSMVMFLACVVGLCMLLMFGLCLQKQSDCSYDEDEVGHKIVASVSVVFGFIGIVTSSIGVMLIRHFGKVFGIEDIRSRPPFPTVNGDITNPTIDAENSQVSGAQRERDSQIQQELQLSPFSAFTKPNGDVTNSSFELPQLPPYSPPGNDEVRLKPHGDEETVRDLQLYPLKITNRPPSDAEQCYLDVPHPPSYNAVDIDRQVAQVPTSPYNNSNITVPTEAPPPYVFNSTVEKYMLDQVD